MTGKRPQTIQIFLPDGNPRGIKIAEITNRTVQAILFPRSQFDCMLKRGELSNVGFYLLFGSSEDDGERTVYIGEAENCAIRLTDHQREKDFWNYAVVIISKTHVFTKAHVKFLEHIAIKQAKEIDRYKLENSTIPNKPHVTESMEGDLLDSFDIAKTLLSTLGFPLFDSITRKNTANNTRLDIYQIKYKGIHAEGSLIEEGFVVFEGSVIKLTTSPSYPRILEWRQKLIGEGVLALIDGVYKFVKPHVFGSPSGASDTVLGRSSNGWKKWRNIEGKTLDETKRNVK